MNSHVTQVIGSCHAHCQVMAIRFAVNLFSRNETMFLLIRHLSTRQIQDAVPTIFRAHEPIATFPLPAVGLYVNGLPSPPSLPPSPPLSPICAGEEGGEAGAATERRPSLSHELLSFTLNRGSLSASGLESSPSAPVCVWTTIFLSATKKREKNQEQRWTGQTACQIAACQIRAPKCVQWDLRMPRETSLEPFKRDQLSLKMACICPKKPTLSKETHISPKKTVFVKWDLHVSKETCICQKRNKCVKHHVVIELGISRTNADSQWNPVYKAFHRICCCGNEPIVWQQLKRDPCAGNTRPALEYDCGKQMPSASTLFFLADLLLFHNIKM